MRVMLHPHWDMVKAGTESCISIKPVRKGKHTYYMGTVMLTDVNFVIHNSGVERAQEEGRRNVHAWMSGTLIGEHSIQVPPTPKMLNNLIRVTYHYDVGRFLTVSDNPAKVVDVSDGEFAAGYVCGPNFYIAREF